MKTTGFDLQQSRVDKNRHESSALSQILRFAPMLIGLTLFTIAIWVLYHQLRQTGLNQIISDLQSIPHANLVAAFFLTALNFLILTGYDVLALRYIEHPLPYKRIALTSCVCSAFSQSLGFPFLTGAGIRYRFYSSWGLEPAQIARVILFTGVTFWLGILSIAGISISLQPQYISHSAHFLAESGRPLGIFLILLVFLYIFWGFYYRKSFVVKGNVISPPSSNITLAQVFISSFDWAIAAAVLYVILAPVISFSYLQFLGIFVLAQTFGVASHVPGGLGVFEGAILLMLGPEISVSAAIGGLLAYRIIYYVVPLILASAIFGKLEIQQSRERWKEIWDLIESWIARIIPSLFALLVFIAGVILLFSGATPGIDERLLHINPLVPLPLLETSHFIGSVAGAALLILARGLQRRLDGAYAITICLLATGALASVAKGLDYEEALILCLILLLLVPAKKFFYRKASLLSESFSTGWILSIVLVLLASIWLGMFSYKHIEYSRDLWWQFTLNGNAPRFLRATVGAIGITFCFAILRMLRPAAPSAFHLSSADLQTAKEIVKDCDKTYANLALLGDKRLLFTASKSSFLMYNIEGRSWITMGDPVGNPTERADLVWQFRELCDLHDAWPVFYEVSPESLPLYLDLGLTLLKLGEEARIPLKIFSMDGASRKGFRNHLHKLEKAGCTFEVVPQEKVLLLLDDFKTISENWLHHKNTREKGFSLGFFDEVYLLHFPAAIVRQNGKVLAFVNVWQSANKSELSVDLMRYRYDAPPGVMEYLFLQLILWGKNEGYTWFNLGMAPFSGMQSHAMAPLWNRFGALLFRHGEQFYNFQGLRLYKEKFDPVWEPRYLASPSGLALPRILANLASLVSGGLKGVITK
jgi:phosphatidylglycerol lysyltransferase